MIVSYAAPPASAPDPRLTARSMLSLGTEDFFAFWMASNSVGLPAGSPPPVRAATSMFLISLAKSLPRLASMPAFLRFVVAHLEWPLTSPPLVRRRRRPARPGELLSSKNGRSPRTARAPGGPRSARGGSWWPPDSPGGRRRSYRRPVPPRPGRGPAPPHRPPPPTARGPPPPRPSPRPRRTGPPPPRRADEHRVHGPAVDAVQQQVGLEAVDLPAEGVAPHGDVQPADRLLVARGVEQPVGEQDHPGARAVDRQPVRDRLAQRLEQPEPVGQLRDRRRFTARQHEAVDGVELVGTTDRHGLGALGTQDGEVLADVALQREHPDERSPHHPRVAYRSLSGSVLTL